MFKISTNGKNGNFNIELPTTLKEVSTEVVYNATKDVKVAPNYVLIGLVYRENLSALVLTSKQSNKATLSVVPIFIKAGDNSSGFINKLYTGNRLIISGSQIALGYHVGVKDNPYSIADVLHKIEGDTSIYEDATKFSHEVMFLEFKIVPICDIVGAYTD